MTPPAKYSFIILGMMAMTLTACEHAPRHAQHSVPPNATAYYVKVAPPPKPSIDRPAKPSSKAVWIDGYWSWTGIDYTWAKGYWAKTAPLSQNWVPSRWIKTDRGWYRKHGCWSDRCVSD